MARSPQTTGGDHRRGGGLFALVAVVAGLGALLFSLTSRARGRFSAANPGRAAAVGDSITAHGGYVSVLNTIPGYTWDNHGVVGETTRRILDRRSEWATPQYGEILILAGNNDFPGVEASTTIANLTTMITAAKAAGARVVVVTTLPWRGYGSWSLERQARQDSVNRWIKTQSGADRVVDAYAALNDGTGRTHSKLVAADGLHLNAAGQQFLGELIKREAY